MIPALLRTALAAFFAISSLSAQAESRPIEQYQGRKVSRVELKGLKRIENDAVLNKVVTKAGATIDRDILRTDVQNLFKMGYFDEIEVEADSRGSDVELTYTFKERPAIAMLSFEGNERVSDDDLKDVVKTKEWAILDINRVKEDIARIQKHYEEKGFYLTKVQFQVNPIEKKDDEIELKYIINDYEKVQIKKIIFLNNKIFSDKELKNVFQETREGSFFSFINGSGNFKESSFKTDLQRLTYWYLDHGYVKFRYEAPVVTISDDKKWLFISIYVDEGQQYDVRSVDFGGDLLYTKEELSEELKLTPGDTFSFSKRNEDIQMLTEKYQDLGYAFVNVIPQMAIDDEKLQLDMTYNFEKGNLVYFRDIYVTGNTKTHDKVVRRELRIYEGELFSGSGLRKSRENVERLGFFAPGEVVFNTLTVKDRNDQVDIEVKVKERPTGTITLGAGYGSVQGFFFQTQVSEINLFGKGQVVSFSAQFSADRVNRSFTLGFTDPYAFDTKWSMGFDIFSTNSSIPNLYESRKLGFDLRFGHPIGEYTNAYITYKNESLKISRTRAASSDLAATDNGVLSSVVWSVVRDRRNNRFETSDGNYQSMAFETAGVGGDKKFLKLTANNRFYKRIVGDLVFRNSIEYGTIFHVDDRPIPISERFFLGGPFNLKGYDPFSVGPQRVNRDENGTQFIEPVGGEVQTFALFELEYPFIREAGLKWVVFYDAGNAFTRGDPFTIRTDAGFGLRWFSPIGPLRFEWGFPFRAKPGEDSPVFNFFIGPPF